MKANNTTETRKGRQYKIADSAYNNAMKKASKKKVHLANIIEDVVTAYGNGHSIRTMGKNAESISFD